MASLAFVLADQGLESLVVVCVAFLIPILSESVPEFGGDRANRCCTDGHTYPLECDVYICLEFAIANMEYSDDDPASVLTPAQRQYLLGEKELSESGERALKRRIHERYRAGLKDLTLLAEYSHLDELLVDDDRLESQLRSAVAFVYRAAEMADLEGDELIEAGVVEGRRGHAEVLLKQFREDPLSLTLQEVRELKSYGKISDEDLFPLFEDDPALVLDKDLSPTVSTFIDRGEDDDE